MESDEGMTNKARRLLILAVSLVLLIAGITIIVKNVQPFLVGNKVQKAAAKPAPVLKNTPLKQPNENLPLYTSAPAMGAVIGDLRIPKLGATLSIYEGANEDELARGVGHFARSVLPGEKDNTILSGHRDTVFRRLGEVGKNDTLIVQTSAGVFTYKVYKVRIVDANDRTVIVPKPRATLTVTTCYPFHYIGDAPKRYVLVANLIHQKLTHS
jgi:sortase A